MRDLIKVVKESRKDREKKSKEEEEGKSPAPGGVQIHGLQIMRRVLCRCATTAALFKALFYLITNPFIQEEEHTPTKYARLQSARASQVHISIFQIFQSQDDFI